MKKKSKYNTLFGISKKSLLENKKDWKENPAFYKR